MTLISKTAGTLSLFSSIKDIHETAVIYSNKEVAKVSSDTFISTSLGTQKTNTLSPRDTRRKNWLLKNVFTYGVIESWASVKGYLKGVINGIYKYAPNIALAALALGVKKHKLIANASAIVLGVLEGYDLITTTTGLDQRKDYLKIK